MYIYTYVCMTFPLNPYRSDIFSSISAVTWARHQQHQQLHPPWQPGPEMIQSPSRSVAISGTKRGDVMGLEWNFMDFLIATSWDLLEKIFFFNGTFPWTLVDLNGIRMEFRKPTYWKYRPSYMYNSKVYVSGLNFRWIPKLCGFIWRTPSPKSTPSKLK